MYLFLDFQLKDPNIFTECQGEAQACLLTFLEYTDNLNDKNLTNDDTFTLKTFKITYETFMLGQNNV